METYKVDFSSPDAISDNHVDMWDDLTSRTTVKADGVLLKDLQSKLGLSSDADVYITSGLFAWGTCSFCGGTEDFIEVSARELLEDLRFDNLAQFYRWASE